MDWILAKFRSLKITCKGIEHKAVNFLFLMPLWS